MNPILTVAAGLLTIVGARAQDPGPSRADDLDRRIRRIVAEELAKARETLLQDLRKLLDERMLPARLPPAAEPGAPGHQGRGAPAGPPGVNRRGRDGLALPEPADANHFVLDLAQTEPGRLPKGLTSVGTAGTPAGRWEVVAGDAHSGRALAQLDGSQVDRRFLLAIADATSFLDLRVSVRGKAIDGEIDQAIGLVWRYQDPDNYYLVRANALESNVRLYRVVGGNRIKFAGKEDLEIPAQKWHTLQVDHRGDLIAVRWNGNLIFEAHDATFDRAGKVGLWTKADSVTWFQGLQAQEIETKKIR